MVSSKAARPSLSAQVSGLPGPESVIVTHTCLRVLA